MDFLGIGGWEILLVIVVALILVGPGKVVEIARTLGRIVHKFKTISGELTAQISRELDEQKQGTQTKSGKTGTPP